MKIVLNHMDICWAITHYISNRLEAASRMNVVVLIEEDKEETEKTGKVSFRAIVTERPEKHDKENDSMQEM